MSHAAGGLHEEKWNLCRRGFITNRREHTIDSCVGFATLTVSVVSAPGRFVLDRRARAIFSVSKVIVHHIFPLT